jgi:hypothetical protein
LDIPYFYDAKSAANDGGDFVNWTVRSGVRGYQSTSWVAHFDRAGTPACLRSVCANFEFAMTFTVNDVSAQQWEGRWLVWAGEFVLRTN